MKRKSFILILMSVSVILLVLYIWSEQGQKDSTISEIPLTQDDTVVDDVLTTSTPMKTISITPETIVDHTAQMTATVIIARAEFNTDEGKVKAFDGLYSIGTKNLNWSKWLDNGGIPSVDDPSWIRIEFPAKVIVDKLVIVSANDDFGRDPEDFHLQASNDGINWETIASWRGEQFVDRFQAREFPFRNSERYSKYRLEITKNDEDVPLTQLCEIKLFGPKGGIPVPAPTPSATPQPTPIPQQSKARIIEPIYATEDIVIADYDVVNDYGADTTGADDATNAIQQALDDCFFNGGGTVWLPVGMYKVTQSILVKPFCTLRGDWADPDLATEYGTLIRAEIPAGETPLFLIGGSAGVVGMTVYYPTQDALEPIEYGWTFEIRGYGDDLDTGEGNNNYHASSVVNVTMLNSYKGIGLNAPPYENAVHELSRVDNVKGTVLYRGIDARNCADVGMWRHITFNNSYWANAPQDYNPPSRPTLDAWTRANGEAFVFADVEWDSFYNLSAEDYQIGIHFVDGTRIAFAGQFAGVRISDTDIAVKADADSIDARHSAWGVSFLRSEFSGSSYAVENNSIGYIHLVDSKVIGRIRSKYRDRIEIQNPGSSPLAYQDEDAFHRPSRAVIYNVRIEPYFAPSTLGSIPSEDATGVIQRALDDAGNDGGGVVYLPAGWYRISTHLNVPANVELRGSSTVLHRSQSGLSHGTVLFAYQEGMSSPALVTLNGSKSGVRGIRVFYPGNSGVDNVWREYPYAVRINGVKDAYVINVTIENGFQGLIAEAGSDHHYIKNMVGATTHGFIRIFANSSGWIEDCHSNPNFWMRLGGYGISPWLAEPRDLWKIRKKNDRLIHIEEAIDEHLLNNFGYANLHGVHLTNANADIYNIGTDNVGGFTVLNDEGSGEVRVMNSMRYNGNENTSNVTISFNELHLK